MNAYQFISTLRLPSILNVPMSSWRLQPEQHQGGDPHGSTGGVRVPGGGEEAAHQAAAAALAPRQGALSPRAQRSTALQVSESSLLKRSAPTNELFISIHMVYWYCTGGTVQVYETCPSVRFDYCPGWSPVPLAP